MTVDETREGRHGPRVELSGDGNLALRRVHDEPAGQDGARVLVDRIWPRGLSSRQGSQEVDAIAEQAGRGWIVVGVDGSPGARAAVEWAMREARLRGCSVRAVMAWRYSPSYGDAWMWPVEGFDALTECEQVLSSLVAEFSHPRDDARSGPRVAITAEVVQGHPGQSLLVAAAHADLLVVGSRGRGGLVGALLGSVSQHVVAHARCPVVVVPDPERRRTVLET